MVSQLLGSLGVEAPCGFRWDRISLCTRLTTGLNPFPFLASVMWEIYHAFPSVIAYFWYAVMRRDIGAIKTGCGCGLGAKLLWHDSQFPSSLIPSEGFPPYWPVIWRMWYIPLNCLIVVLAPITTITVSLTTEIHFLVNFSFHQWEHACRVLLVVNAGVVYPLGCIWASPWLGLQLLEAEVTFKAYQRMMKSPGCPGMQEVKGRVVGGKLNQEVCFAFSECYC